MADDAQRKRTTTGLLQAAVVQRGVTRLARCAATLRHGREALALARRAAAPGTTKVRAMYVTDKGREALPVRGMTPSALEADTPRDVQVTPCGSCLHYWRPRYCAAFPEGTPDDITLGRHKHRTPYPGDHGIQYTEDPAKAGRYWRTR